MWHMPLDDEYKEYLKSAFADLPNIGGRWGGAITAAKFLQDFVEDKPWVHLDIAGVAWLDEAKMKRQGLLPPPACSSRRAVMSNEAADSDQLPVGAGLADA